MVKEIIIHLIGPKWIPIPKSLSSKFRVFNFGPNPLCYELINRLSCSMVQVVNNNGEVMFTQEWYLGTNWVYIKDLPSGDYIIKNIDPGNLNIYFLVLNSFVVNIPFKIN